MLNPTLATNHPETEIKVPGALNRNFGRVPVGAAHLMIAVANSAMRKAVGQRAADQTVTAAPDSPNSPSRSCSTSPLISSMTSIPIPIVTSASVQARSWARRAIGRGTGAAPPIVSRARPAAVNARDDP